jgi:hypothetical protein
MFGTMDAAVATNFAILTPKIIEFLAFFNFFQDIHNTTMHKEDECGMNCMV